MNFSKIVNATSLIVIVILSTCFIAEFAYQWWYPELLYTEVIRIEDNSESFNFELAKPSLINRIIYNSESVTVIPNEMLWKVSIAIEWKECNIKISDLDAVLQQIGYYEAIGCFQN